jgi:hypothetical protein
MGSGERSFQYARDVQRVASGAVPDLVAATEAVGNNERRWRRGAHCGQQREFAHRHRHVVVARLVTERAGHAAAARFDDARAQSGNPPQHLCDRLDRGEGLLVAMSVHERFGRLHALQLERHPSDGFLADQKLLEQQRVCGE